MYAGGSSRGLWLFLGLGLLVGVIVGLLVFVDFSPVSPALTASGGAAAGAPAPAPVAGAPAPDFTLEDLSGNSVSLSTFKGRPVLINFWATWCGPCRVEMPYIKTQYQANRDQGLVVLAVNFDEPKASVQAFVEALDLPFTVLLDPGAKVTDLYRVRGFPSSHFVDGDGMIRVVHVGMMTEGQLQDNLGKIMR